jgi:hypothetical protein
LPPDLLEEHRIADFGENVYMLYVAEMVQDFMLLLLIYTFEISRFSSIPFLICTFRKVEVVARIIEFPHVKASQNIPSF